MKTLLTVPIQVADPKSIAKTLKRKLPQVNAFEIWIDQWQKKYQQPDLVSDYTRNWKKLTKKKLVFVCKDKQEHGKFCGFNRHRASLLLAAAAAGADYVDISLYAGRSQIEKMRQALKNTKLIISYHSFLKTPSLKKMQNIAQRCKELKADIIKIACHVDSIEDTEKLMNLALDLKKERKKHIILGMGILGITTRVFASKLGNELNFVSLEKSTAPGQLSLKEMVQFQKVLS